MSLTLILKSLKRVMRERDHIRRWRDEINMRKNVKSTCRARASPYWRRSFLFYTRATKIQNKTSSWKYTAGVWGSCCACARSHVSYFSVRREKSMLRTLHRHRVVVVVAVAASSPHRRMAVGWKSTKNEKKEGVIGERDRKGKNVSRVERDRRIWNGKKKKSLRARE